MLRLLPALILLLGVAVLPGCAYETNQEADQTTYEVRGRFLGTASEGRDVVVHHEPVPGVMDRAMIMTLPLEDDEAVDPLEKGDPVAFTLVVGIASLRIEDLRPLPDTTTLNLPTPADSTDAAPGS